MMYFYRKIKFTAIVDLVRHYIDENLILLINEVNYPEKYTNQAF